VSSLSLSSGPSSYMPDSLSVGAGATRYSGREALSSTNKSLSKPMEEYWVSLKLIDGENNGRALLVWPCIPRMVSEHSSPIIG
jgi:hypothetical protein